MLLRNRALAEEFLHQLVLAFRHQFHQRLVRPLGRFFQSRGDLPDLAVTVAAGRIEERLHGDQINHAFESFAVRYGQLNGNALPAKTIRERAQRRLRRSRGPRMVHLVDHHRARQIEFLGVFPYALRHGLDPGHGIHRHQRGLHRGHRGTRFVHEHMKTGRIDKVHLHAVPFGKSQRVLHRGPAGDILFVVRGDGRSILHTAQSGGHFCGMQQSGNQRGLPAVRMPHYSYVADLTSLVGFHSRLLVQQIGRDPRKAGPP